MKYLINFRLPPKKGWSEIVDIDSNKDTPDDRHEAKLKAQTNPVGTELLAILVFKSL